MTDFLTNSQALDGVLTLDNMAIGLSAPQAGAMLDAVMVDTLGMAMHNAVQRQQQAALVGAAVAAAASARLLHARALSAAPPAPTVAGAPPPVEKPDRRRARPRRKPVPAAAPGAGS